MSYETPIQFTHRFKRTIIVQHVTSLMSTATGSRTTDMRTLVASAHDKCKQLAQLTDQNSIFGNVASEKVIFSIIANK